MVSAPGATLGLIAIIAWRRRCYGAGSGLKTVAGALDCLLILDRRGTSISDGMIKNKAVAQVDEELVSDLRSGNFKVHVLPLSKMAISQGELRQTNVVSLGALFA